MTNVEKNLFNVRSFADVAELVKVSPKQLKYLLYVLRPACRYRTFDLPKRRGGCRTIRAPRRELKYIQRVLADCLYRVYKPRHCSHGFCLGKSVVSNADLHYPARYVFNVDLKDFFPSINFGRVRGLFMSVPFNLPPDAATVLAQICCHDNALPQGAPTSPVLSNMICSRMDGQLTQLAKRHRCRYSRYVDDMTFSKKTSDFPPEVGFAGPDCAHVGPELAAIIEGNGFQIHQNKVYLQSNRRRQRVTGLIVNKCVNVPRRFVRQIRAMIHAWAKYGEEAANEHHSACHYRRTARNCAPPQIAAVIRGKLEFIKMVKGFEDPVYRNLQRQFAKVFAGYIEVMKEENSRMLKRDVFISHSSDDKLAIAKPLADALIASGHSVWYDEYEIKLGDSLLQKINEGLAHSRFGVVILSKSFFSKKWPQRELDGLTSLETAAGKSRIIPIWHGLAFEEVAKYSPILAGLMAADTSKDNLDRIVLKIAEVL